MSNWEMLQYTNRRWCWTVKWMAVNLALAPPIVHALGRSSVTIEGIWDEILDEIKKKKYEQVVHEYKRYIYMDASTMLYISYDHGMIDITVRRDRRWMTYFIDHATVYRQARDEEKVFLAYPQWRSALSSDM